MSGAASSPVSTGQMQTEAQTTCSRGCGGRGVVVSPGSYGRDSGLWAKQHVTRAAGADPAFRRTSFAMSILHVHQEDLVGSFYYKIHLKKERDSGRASYQPKVTQPAVDRTSVQTQLHFLILSPPSCQPGQLREGSRAP